MRGQTLSSPAGQDNAFKPLFESRPPTSVPMSAADALTFADLLALLKGEQPLPESSCLAYSLPLSHKQVQELVPLLQDNEQVRGLKLRGCRLDNEAANDLSRVLAFNRTLRHLDLRDNDIGATGAAFLANAFRNFNYHLLALDLTGNPALAENPEAVQEIAMFIHRNSQHRGTPPANSPVSSGRALVRFQEVPPDTPAGRTRLNLNDAELERRFQALERAQEASATEMAGLSEVGASLAEYRASLDVASQQMALVLEMLRADVDALKERLEGQKQGEGLAAAAAAQAEQQCGEMQVALARLQKRVEDDSQHHDVVQLLEAKLEKLEASKATQQQQGMQELKQQVALATTAADKAGGEAEAVASSMKAVGASIKGLHAEVIANTASFARAQQQAADAVAAVGTLEEQIRTLQLSMDAMEQALDGTDMSQQLAAVQAHVAELATEHEAAAAATAQQADQLRAGLQDVEEQQGEVAAQVQALVGAQLPDRAAQLEAAVAKLKDAANEQTAVISQLMPANAVVELRQSMAAALGDAVARLSAAQVEHATAVAGQLAELPAPYDDGALQGRVSAAEGTLQQVRDALAAFKAEDLQQLRSVMQAQLRELAEQQAVTAERAAAADGAVAELRQNALSRHAALKAALEEQQAAAAEKLAALEGAVEEQQAKGAERLAVLEAALAAIPVFDDAPLRAEMAARVLAAQAEKAGVQQALTLLAKQSAKAAEKVGQEAEMRQAALADELASLSAELAAIKAAQAIAGGRLAAADELEQLRMDAKAQLAELAGQVAALKEAQAAATAGQQASAADMEQVRQSAQEAVTAVEKLRGASSKQLEALYAQVAAAEQQATQARSALAARLAAAEGEVQRAAQRLAVVEATTRPDESADNDPSVLAAALAEQQQQCERLRLSAEEAVAAAAAELAALRADFNQHRVAVLGQCTELQEGLEAVPVYEDRLAAAEARLDAAEQQLAAVPPATVLEAAAAQLTANMEAQHASLVGHVAALEEAVDAQHEQLTSLQASAAQTAEQLALLAPAAAVVQLQEAAAGQKVAVAEQLGELGAKLKAVKVLADAHQEQLAQLEAAAQELAPIVSVDKLRGVVEVQQVAVASQLGVLLSSLQAAADSHFEQLGEVQAGLKAAEGSAAAAHDRLAALQHAVAQAQQDAAQGITSAAAAVLCQEAIRPLDECLVVVARQQGEQAAGGGEALAKLEHKLEGLQGALISYRQEHAALADTVGEMRGNALAVAAAVAERSPGMLPAPAHHLGSLPRTVTPLPSLQLGLMHAADVPTPNDLASFPLTDRTLYNDCESEEEEGDSSAAMATAAVVAVQARQHLRLEGIVAQQSQRIHQLEAELLCLKQLLMGGSPLVVGHLNAAVGTPAGQHFFDAESVLSDTAPVTTGRPWRLAATPTDGSSTRAAPTGRGLVACGAVAADASELLGLLDRQYGVPHPTSASFGGDITNSQRARGTGGNGTAARKPTVAPAAHPTATPPRVSTG